MAMASFDSQQGEITAVAACPTANRAVSSAQLFLQKHGDAVIWDLLSGTVVGRLQGHRAGVFSAAYSPNGKLIATGGGGRVIENQWVHDNSIILWNEDGEQIRRFATDLFFVQALAFSPNGAWLLSGSSNHAPKAPVSDGANLRLWEVDSGRELQRFGKHQRGVNAVAFSPDNSFVVCGTDSMGFVGKPLFRFPLAKMAHPRTIRVWQLKSGREMDLFDEREWVTSLSLSSDGALLASSGSHGIALWDLPSGRLSSRDLGPNGYTHCCAFSPDGKFIAAGTGGRNEFAAPFENCMVRLYEVHSHRETARWEHRRPVKSLCFTPDGRFVFAGGYMGELHLWEVPFGGE